MGNNTSNDETNNLIAINRKVKKLTNKAIKNEVVFTLFEYEIHSVKTREEIIAELKEI